MGDLPVLSIHHYERGGGRLADLTWKGAKDVTVSFTPQFNRFDLEDLRWYHENYRENWLVSSNAMVQRIQYAELNIGKTIHSALFHDEASNLAENIRSATSNLRIEIHDEVHGAAVPWELIADPETGTRLALAASSLVRVTAPETPIHSEKAVCTSPRLLVVISRPKGEADIGYWSVAHALWRELSLLPFLRVEVLRPPTFEALERRLDAAAKSGTPYTAVHFDGHGVIMDPFGSGQTKGYLLFETAGRARPEFIDGATIGKALTASGIFHFSMNACRSADSRSGDAHLRAEPEITLGQPSIVEAVLREGVASCIGMNREIYAGTAKRFFRIFYPEFFSGRSAGEAVRIARGRLHEEPLAAATFDDEIAPIDDWSIPVVGERVVTRLQINKAHRGEQRDSSWQHSSSLAGSLSAVFPEELSAPAVVGFDKEILALEDSLAVSSVVLVCGPILSGKSRLAVEYATWRSATSATSCPVQFVRLSPSDTPSSLAARMLSWKPALASAYTDPTACAIDLNSANGILILDQADRLSPETESFLGAVLSKLGGALRVIITARGETLSWLPNCRSLTPRAFFRGARVELGRRWAESNGTKFNRAEFHSLLFFSGGRPGMILLLLGAAQNLISSHKARAEDIASWLHDCDWERIAELARAPGPGLPSVEKLIDELVGHLSTVCARMDLAMIRVLSRFNVYCDAISAARLITMVLGSETSADSASRVMGKLTAAGLASRVANAAEPAWFLHPFLKLVASRLDKVSASRKDDLNRALVETLSRRCAELVNKFRDETTGVVDILGMQKQNASETVRIAIKDGQLESACHLTEALCLYCRFTGDMDLAIRILNLVLPHLIDERTGRLRPQYAEIGLRVWDQAIWVSPRWPRHSDDPVPRGSVQLMPPDDDHYAVGLWFRANNKMAEASMAFRAELESPAKCPRYAPGDIECQLSETVYDPDEPRTWADALSESRGSYAARLPEDALGRAWSRISEARIRLAMMLAREEYRFREEDVTGRVELLPDDRAGLGELAALVREAQSEEGGQSEENNAQAAMVLSHIMLTRRDLTSAISYFEEGTSILMTMEDASILQHYWTFAVMLLRHGWIQRSYELAVNAFYFAMKTGDWMLSTKIREFCQNLKATYPEVIHDPMV